MKSKIITLLAALAFAVSSHAAPVQNSTNGHWYEYIDGSFTWQDAYDDAGTKTYLGLTGYLATVTSEDENNFIANYSGALGWLGGSDNGSGVNDWTWRSGPEAGQAFTFTAWAPGEPNNCCGGEDYLQMNWGFGTWNDHGGPGNWWQTNGYFVEFGDAGSVPEPGSLALFGIAIAGLGALRRRNRA